jgi:hypothetical protein
MRINSALFTRIFAVLLLALALNMAVSAFSAGDVAQADSSVYTPGEDPTQTPRPPPTATPIPPTNPPPTNPPPTNPPPTSPPQSTSTPVPPATPTPTKIVVLPPTGLPDGTTGSNLILIAGALATAGAGLLLASRRAPRR